MKTSSAFASVLDLHVSETPIRARDAKPGDRARASGWSHYYVVLAVEPQRDSYVKIQWRCDPGDEIPPTPYTMFMGDEWMATR